MKADFINKATGEEKEITAFEADGKSYFILNALADSTTKIVTRFEKTDGSTFQLGTADDANLVYVKLGDQCCEVAFGDKTYVNTSEAIRKAGEHAIELGYSTMVDDGKLLMVPKSKFSVKNEIALFGISKSGEVECDEKQAGTKLLSCKIFSDDKLLRDYVPAEDENGVKCLLEKIGKFVIYPQLENIS